MGSTYGPQGPQGPAGPAGPAGPTVVNPLNRVEGPVVTVAAASFGTASAVCPAGQTVVSGGFTSAASDGEVFGSDTYGATDRWIALLDNFDAAASTGTIQAFAYCAPTGQAISARTAASKRSAAGDAVAAAIEARRAVR